MPDITNPQAVRFANEVIRPLADAYAQLYFRTQAVAAEWVAQNIGGIIPNTADTIIDGSAQDGRAQITGADVNLFAGQAVAFLADADANAKLKLKTMLRIAVNPVR